MSSLVTGQVPRLHVSLQSAQSTAATLAESIVPELLVSTTLQDQYAPAENSSIRGEHSPFINELHGAVVKVIVNVLQKEHSFLPLKSSDGMHSLSLVPKEDHSDVKAAFKEKKGKGIQALDVINAKYGPFEVEYNEYEPLGMTLIELRFTRPIDVQKTIAEYMATGMFESVEKTGSIGDGDRFYAIPSKAEFDALVKSGVKRRLDDKTMARYNQALVQTEDRDDASKHPQWWFVASHGWGDCSAGCTYRRNYLLSYDRKSENVKVEKEAGDKSTDSSSQSKASGRKGIGMVGV